MLCVVRLFRWYLINRYERLFNDSVLCFILSLANDKDTCFLGHLFARVKRPWAGLNAKFDKTSDWIH